MKLGPKSSLVLTHPVGWSFTPADRRTPLLVGPDDALLLPRGIVGLYGGPPGGGKSLSLIQLALSVATGRPWLGHYRPSASGAVAIISAEDDDIELHHRWYELVRGMGLDRSEISQAEKSIVIVNVDLITTSVSLSESTTIYKSVGSGKRMVREYSVTDACSLIYESLAREPLEYALVIFDPVSAFGESGVETDSAIATYFMRHALGTFRSLPGGPTVLVAHHTTKIATGSMNDHVDQNAIRGSSALTGAARWVSLWWEDDANDYHFAVAKSNQTRYRPHVICRPYPIGLGYEVYDEAAT